MGGGRCFMMMIKTECDKNEIYFFYAQHQYIMLSLLYGILCREHKLHEI